MTGAHGFYVEAVDEGRPCLTNPHNGELVDGPWLEEPDFMWWVHRPTDLECMIRRNDMGAWCGYVGVPEGHPAWQRDPFDMHLEAAPSLNFGRRMPSPYEPHADLYWLGFDCAHAPFDVVPTMDAYLHSVVGRSMPSSDYFHPTYKDVNYVRGEVVVLAEELGRMGA